MFYPFLTYGIVVWGATYENLLKPVLTAQKKVIRAITFSEPTAHSSPLFSDLKILSLVVYINFIFPHLFLNAIMTLLELISETFLKPISSIHSYNIRGASRGDFFFVRKNTLQYGIRSICYNGVRIWNNIPSEIRNSTSVKAFRKNFKNSLLESYVISWLFYRFTRLAGKFS